MIKLGVYRHFKGNEYKVLGIAKHSETLEEFVVYEALYKNSKNKLWVRPVAMFLEKVNHDGITEPRFKYISKI
jgi:hypothetical protein